MEKYKIQKDSVQETLIIPLYGRKLAMDMYPENFSDHDCQQLIEQIDYDFPRQSKVMEKIGAIMGATRQYDLAAVCKEYLSEHPNACVVNLGCGLDTTFRQVDNGTAKGYNIDFPDVIAVRNQLLPESEREKNIAGDLKDTSWFSQIDYKPEEGAVFFASGVFYYFKREDVKKLFCSMAEHFPGGKLAFDATNARGLKNMLKTWLKPSEMGNVGVYFSLEDEKELLDWSNAFSGAVRKGYLAGYRPLDKRYGVIVNLVFRYLDKHKMCQIIELSF
ncbi:MAG: class I SAM-dependent methyltransferase [Lachnospiraceae bacterium]|nr:class I SAM-dependent methyltransferase [Lachnospiraceae bacterium]